MKLDVGFNVGGEVLQTRMRPARPGVRAASLHHRRKQTPHRLPPNRHHTPENSRSRSAKQSSQEMMNRTLWNTARISRQTSTSSTASWARRQQLSKSKPSLHSWPPHDQAVRTGPRPLLTYPEPPMTNTTQSKRLTLALAGYSWMPELHQKREHGDFPPNRPKTKMSMKTRRMKQNRMPPLYPMMNSNCIPITS